MRDRIALTLGYAAFLGWQWSQLERPSSSVAVILVLIACAVVPAFLWASGRRALAVAGLVAGTLVAVQVAFGFAPLERHHPAYPVRLWDGISGGVRSWLDTTTPIDTGRFADASGDVRLLFTGLLALLAWTLVVWRRPLLTIVVGFTAFAIPSTMVATGADGLRSAIFLILAALTLAVCGGRAVPRRGSAGVQIAAVTACAIAAALILAAAPGVRKDAFLDWRSWNPLAADAPRVSVGYVWNQSYRPFHWPKKQTEVFEVTAPRPMYWKAAVLNAFDDDRWVEQSQIERIYGSDTDTIQVPDDLIPALAAQSTPQDIVQLTFHIKGLADPHLLSAEQPMSYDLSDADKAQLNADGTALVEHDPGRDSTYKVRVYAPDPKPSELALAGSAYSPAIQRSISVAGVQVPAWGSGEPAVRLPLDPSYVAASNQVWKASGAARAPTPYEAVIAVEAYLRSPIFHYDQTPNYKQGGPLLVDFLERSHRGYCQMFSGAMGLILRLHGIPARIAVGFTTGKPVSRGSSTYRVTDRNAHSWVEVYFPGYGWLPFDPTPSRSLPQRASTATPNLNQLRSDASSLPGLSKNISSALGQVLGLGGPRALPNGRSAAAFETRHGRGGEAVGGPGGVLVLPDTNHRGSFLRWLALAALVVLALVLIAKVLVVRVRYLSRGPRGRATAAFTELATFAGDQGVEIGSAATYEDLAKRLSHVWGVDAFPFAADANVARYGRPQDAEGAAGRLRGHVRRLKRDIRHNLDLSDRAKGAVRLREALSRRHDLA
jgi:transglutaminase-like putative cysteine protease